MKHELYVASELTYLQPHKKFWVLACTTCPCLHTLQRNVRRGIKDVAVSAEFMTWMRVQYKTGWNLKGKNGEFPPHTLSPLPVLHTSGVLWNHTVT